jgi:hypothetical protein
VTILHLVWYVMRCDDSHHASQSDPSYLS